MALTNILVPVDLGPSSETALQQAVSLALSEGSAIHLLCVIDGTQPMTVVPAEGLPAPVEIWRSGASVEEAHSQLRALAEQFEASDVPIHTRVETASGSLASIIGRVADEVACDLIVMATHGRKGVRRLVQGSVAEKVVRDAKEPVLLVPPAAAGNGERGGGGSLHLPSRSERRARLTVPSRQV
jgi:nucleotide-binding universal stress UspA family protein